MKWICGILVALAVTVGIVWLIGWQLPVSHRASVSRTLPADADTIWSRIGNLSEWPSWRTDVSGIEVLGEDAVRVSVLGDTVRYDVERPGGRKLVTVIATDGLPYGGHWSWSVVPAGEDAATVTLVEEGEVYDPFFRFFSRFVFGYESTMRSVLDQLEASLDER